MNGLDQLQAHHHFTSTRQWKRTQAGPERVRTSSLVSVSTILSALKECSRSRDIQRGERVHAEALSSKLCSNIYVASSLINMYGKCRNMAEARKVFESLHHRNVVTWTALIMGYVENGESKLALEMFQQMENNCAPNSRTMVAAISACAALAAAEDDAKLKRRWLDKGRQVYSQAVRDNCSDMYVESALVDLYARCGSMVEARKVYDSMKDPNVVAWSALLQGYVDNGESEVALELFENPRDGCTPNDRSYVAALSACAALAGKQGCEHRNRWFLKGEKLYSLALGGRCSNVYVENTLMDLYSKCGKMVEARKVFDSMVHRDAVSWTVLLQGFVENSESELALQLFDVMHRQVSPNARTFVVALSACATLAELSRQTDGDSTKWFVKGKEIHSEAASRRCLNIYVKNTLIDMYAKCGATSEARAVFESMDKRDSVSWTAMVMGYVINGENEKALELVSCMQARKALKSSATFVAALIACGNLFAVETGRGLHAEIRACGLEQDVVVANSLVDFYGKCGNMEAAKQAFDGISEKTVVSWTALLDGYSQNGDTASVFQVFERMIEARVAPNEVTFVCLLTACSHAGLTDKGREVFDAMRSKYGIRAGRVHYNCLVDLLGRANLLEEAVRVVEVMPFKPDVVTWRAILGACRKWNNDGVGRLAYESLLRMNDLGGASAAYVLMASISSGLKTQGTSWWTDETGRVHKFDSQ